MYKLTDVEKLKIMLEVKQNGILVDFFPILEEIVTAALEAQKTRVEGITEEQIENFLYNESWALTFEDKQYISQADKDRRIAKGIIKLLKGVKK